MNNLGTSNIIYKNNDKNVAYEWNIDHQVSQFSILVLFMVNKPSDKFINFIFRGSRILFQQLIYTNVPIQQSLEHSTRNAMFQS